ASRLTPDRTATHRPEPVDSTGDQEANTRRAPASPVAASPVAASPVTAPPAPAPPGPASRPESRRDSRPAARAEARPESRIESRPAAEPVSRPRLSGNTARTAQEDVGFADIDDVADTHLASSSEQPAPAESRFHYLWSAGTGALAILLFAQI